MLLRMEDNPGLFGATTDYDETQPQLDVRLLRDRAADLGISADDVGQTLQAMLASTVAPLPIWIAAENTMSCSKQCRLIGLRQMI
jgi:multidrug efflux pump subunit AcrB